MTWRSHALGKTCLTEQQVATARQLREKDAGAYTWAKLGVLFDCAAMTVRRALEPDYAATCRAHVNAHRQHRSAEYARSHGPMSREQYRKSVMRLPEDTRNFTARHFDDPLPGRSALDQRKGAQWNNEHGRLFAVDSAGHRSASTSDPVKQ